ncbi:MAG: tRNA lysidine(34) synthetase TilS [Bacteroidetes bacterium]|nr:MAG: tRNA lysidine(34) synthetase TilS [Bacteroidota bacterium]MBL1145911.1 tRNA lysidine(34) synthetase TilS [Bacteroidota bacterium]MCB0801565.1 tRNA lysidine(34) synthetase TilS [Flavobacteriales bacterium]NOG58705.1 tRNA lysidine(34) synthetase TilS [Bacteroidota bacterium]
MKEAVKNHLKENAWNGKQKFLLAVSGGLDSMVLWHLFHQLKLDYAVAHVNFQLRGEASDGDENLVRETALKRAVPCFVKQADTKQVATEQGISIQMAAREIRYDWFKELMQENDLNFLATAHHLNDSIETFFINLDRGTGIKGLMGISSQENVLRPLISFAKDELKTYALTNEVSYREDASNEDIKYQRNWFRNTMLKEWKTRNPAFEKTMAKNLEHLAAAGNVYQKAIQNDLKAIRLELKKGLFSIKNYHLLEFKEESLFELLGAYGFSETQIQNLKQGIENRQIGLTFNSANYSLNLDRELVFIKELSLESLAQEVEIFRYQNRLESPIKLKFDLISKLDLTYVNNSSTEYVDFDQLSFPMQLRKWEKGDKMKPIGMKGQKKISDILIDLKVPLSQKDSIWVLLSNRKIVWLVGYKISEEFKVNKHTNQVLKIELEH